MKAPLIVEKLENLHLECPRFYFCIINDFNGRNIPLIETFVSDIQAEVKNWSSTMDAKASLSLAANYFNNSIVEFEPLLEDWKVELQVIKADNPQLAIKLSSDTMLNLNVSNAFIESLGAVMDVLNKDYEAIEKLKTLEKYSPYWIANETGVAIEISSRHVKNNYFHFFTKTHLVVFF